MSAALLGISHIPELIAKELRRQDMDAQMAKDLDTITEETQRISRLMDELQNHIKKQDTHLLKTRLNIVELINETAQRVCSRRLPRGKTIHWPFAFPNICPTATLVPLK